MTWLSLALISLSTLSVASVLARVLLKNEDSNPVGYAIIFQLVLGTISLIFAITLKKFVPPSNETSIIRFIFSTLLWAGSTVFGFQTLKRLSAGESTILASSGTFISIGLGIVFLGEVFKVAAIAGTVLILLAVLIIATGNLNFRSREGIIFGLLSSAFAAIAVVNDAVILKTYEAFSYTAIMSFLPGFILLLLFPKQIAKIPKMFDRKSFFIITILCMFYSIQAIAYYLALQNGAPISRLSPIMKSSIVLTVILAAVFIKERSNLKKKLIAAIMVTIGTILLS